MTTSRQYFAQFRAYSGLPSNDVDQPGALLLGAVAQERLNLRRAWAGGRRRRSRSGGQTRHHVVKVAGSTLGLFLVKILC